MKRQADFKTQVAIVGGGPAGLFLACCLQKTGVRCNVFEKRSGPVDHSQSIGIQPVSLELFDNIGLAEVFLKEGVRVKEGRAYCHEKQIGALSFDRCPPPYPFILLLPQYRTEQLLANYVQSAAAGILQWNSTVTDLRGENQKVQLKVRTNGRPKWVEADFVVGCDGKGSFIRKQASISFCGKSYGDNYVMGDFSDNTLLGNAAAIFMCKQGVIESFPLPKENRRWVVKTGTYLPEVTRQDIEQRVQNRIDYHLSGTENTMLSSFGVEKRFAKTMAKDHILLAGDAAHIVSPIGGQGMNLGWLDAWDASLCLLECLSNEEKAEPILQAYSKRRLHIARKAARRAEFNMALGRSTNIMMPRKWLLKALLSSPLSNLMANLFTMRGLRRYII